MSQEVNTLMNEAQAVIRTMTIEDYDGVRALWMTIKGFAIRSLGSSR